MLVALDGRGSVVGELEPFRADTPWWQDLEPVLAAHPDVVVLRLLDVVPDPTGPMGGLVRYLVEAPASWIAANRLRAPSRPLLLQEHPLRMPWARPGGPAADLEWAAARVDVSGRPRQVRSWNLSSIWRLPTRDGDVWLKCVPPFFAHEAYVIRSLAASASVPRLIAAEGHRMLLEAMPGVDGYGASERERAQIAETVVDVLAPTAPRVDELVAGGVPDWRRRPLRDLAADVVARDGLPGDPLHRLVDGWDAVMSKVGDAGLPDVLFHGDPHPGNARIGIAGIENPAGEVIVFDWGDSGVGHPLLDTDVIGEPSLGAWFGAWARAFPGSDPATAWQALQPVAALRGAVVFRRFLDNIEPSERVYHQDDVEPFLAKARERLPV